MARHDDRGYKQHPRSGATRVAATILWPARVYVAGWLTGSLGAMNTDPNHPSDAAPERVYAIADLLDPAALIRLCESFEHLGDCRIAICGNDGRRLDVESEEDDCVPCADADRFAEPVTWQEHVLGRVVILEPDPTDAQREIARLIADVLAGVCLSEARIRKRVEELTTVYDLSGLFAGTEDLPKLLGIAAQRICDVMKVKAASIRELDATGENLRIVAEHNLSERYLRKGSIRVSENPIDRAALAGEVVYIEDAQNDPRIRYPEHARQEGIVSGLCCPMQYRGHTVGVLRIYTATRQRFSRFDIGLLRAIAAQSAGAIVHSQLYREALAAEAYDQQIKRAGQIQRRMLPKTPPRHAGISFGQVYSPTLDVGGDFFDFLELPEGNVGVAVADVVGKGIPAALMMASVRSALRAHARSIYNIHEIVAQVNRQMCRDTAIADFATLLYGVFSSDGRRFTYCNAGHNPAVLLRGDEVQLHGTGGMVIGVDPDTRFEQGVVHLQPGDVLVVYTDGVNEALNYDEELFGFDRLVQSMKRYRDEAAGTLANQVLWDVRRFCGLKPQSDDISVVVAKVH
jgi:sigma-B regulation protein RsbU (phosphoserine phosphatase)